MKTALVLAFLLLASTAFAGERTRGHWKDTNSDGIKDSYVQPYMHSKPDNNPYNNYSTKGNSNPYTGQQGTVNNNPYQSPNTYQPYQQRRSGYR